MSRAAVIAAAGALAWVCAAGPGPAAADPSRTGPETRVRPLTLGEVLRSVDRHYPLVLAAERSREIAEGRRRAARGAFDTKLGLEARTSPSGFYENDRIDLSLSQPLRALGAEIGAGYRLGRGDFAGYDKDLQTNEDGEIRLTARVPLLRDRAIDDRRAGLRKAELGLQKAAPKILQQRIEASRMAVLAYWEWLAAGEKERIARSLLALAETRQSALESAVQEGLIAEIVLVDNQRLLAERRALLIDMERRLQQAAIELSLYYRDGRGDPLIPAEHELPEGFPSLRAPDVDLEADLERAWTGRPELRELRLTLEAVSVEVARARNRLLPSLDFTVGASRDYGVAVNVPDDKGDLELKAGISFELPLQRRDAGGTLASGRAELDRLEQELRMKRDMIGAAVRDAHSAWVQAWRRYEQASRSLELARELEEAERLQLSEGNSDLLRLNIREQQTAQAASFLVDVKTEYFEALSTYRAAIGEIPVS